MKIRLPIEKDPNDTPRPVKIRRGVLTLFIVFSFIGIFIVWSYSSWKTNISDNLATVASPKELTDSDTNNHLSMLAKKMWLPKDSKPPRVFEISDPNLFTSGQSFYEGSMPGDILVIFDESKRAIIYSPKRDIIINSGPITYRDNTKN